MEKNKIQKIVILSLIVAFFFGVVFVFAQEARAAIEYKPMEKIPGFESEKLDSFKNLIETLYRFAMWAVGICALLMITIGGFSYMTSAGNTSKANTGKDIIKDAIIGLVLVFTSVLLFSVINPNLTTVNIEIAPSKGGSSPAPTPTPAPANCSGTVPANSKACTGTSPSTSTTISLVETCATAPCTYQCNANYKKDGDKCVATTSSAKDTCATYTNTNNVIDFTTSEKTSVPSACNTFQADFQNASSSTGIDIKILKAIASQESSCIPNRESPAGACGLVQLKPTTAQKYNPSATCQWLKDNPKESALIAAKYIKDNQGTHGGKLDKIAAGYNAGYGTSPTPDGKKPAFAPSSDCPGSFAYQCCIDPGGLKETQDYVVKVTKYYNSQ